VNFTGLAEFLWFLLLFGAMFAFTVWRQQRDRRRREERMKAMSAPVEFEPEPVAAPVPVQAGPAPDISWGRGPAVPVPPPEIPPNWREAPARPEAAALPPWTPPVATRVPRRTVAAAGTVAVGSREAARFRSAAGMRQAMIALTVLGPCRAIEPHGAQWPQQEPGGGGRARRPLPKQP
jgi:hypothetical protein